MAEEGNAERLVNSAVVHVYFQVACAAGLETPCAWSIDATKVQLVGQGWPASTASTELNVVCCYWRD